MNILVNLIFVSLLFISGCAMKGTPDKRYQYNPERDVVAIFKIVNENGKNSISVRKKSVNKDGVSLSDESLYDVDFANLNSDQGYFVIRLSPVSKGQAFILESIYENHIENANMVPGYGRCASSELFSFRFQKPGIYYMGDLSYKYTSDGFRFHISDNLNEAKRYLKQEYSGIPSSGMVSSKIEVLPIDAKCNSRNIIYIYM